VVERVVDALWDQYVAGFITKDEFVLRLKELQIPEARINLHLERAKIEIRRREMELKKDRILIAFREGRIDRTKALSLLLNAGFDREQAERFIRLQEELAKIP